MKIRNIKTGRFIKTSSKYHCDTCHKEIFIPEWRINRSKNHFCSQSCNNKFRVGEKGRNYINGSSFKNYPTEFNDTLKNKIMLRDENECVLCHLNKEQHKSKYHKNLTVHHIDYNKFNCFENNLITLCLRHNSAVNKKEARNRWIKCFKTIINLQKGILD
jgi:hypothetical protein